MDDERVAGGEQNAGSWRGLRCAIGRDAGKNTNGHFAFEPTDVMPDQVAAINDANLGQTCGTPAMTSVERIRASSAIAATMGGDHGG